MDSSIIVGGMSLVGVIAGLFGTRRVETGKQRREQRRALEAQCRLLEDYSNTLRGALRKAGEEIPPWPAALTTITEQDTDR